MANVFDSTLPRINLQHDSAAHRALTTLYYYNIIWTRYAGVVLDIKGCLAAGQYGAGLIAIQNALHFGIDAFILHHGHFTLYSPYRFETLAEILGTDSELFQEAWRLECGAPPEDEGLEEYATRCRQFVERRLCTQTNLPVLSDLNSLDQRITVSQALHDIQRLMDHLGLASPFETFGGGHDIGQYLQSNDPGRQEDGTR